MSGRTDVRHRRITGTSSFTIMLRQMVCPAAFMTFDLPGARMVARNPPRATEGAPKNAAPAPLVLLFVDPIRFDRDPLGRDSGPDEIHQFLGHAAAISQGLADVKL